MTKLLLDYRWELDAALHNPEVSFALIEFVNLLRKTGLNPAPFVEDQQQNELWQKLGQGPPVRNGSWQPLMEFLDLCRRPDGSMCSAMLDQAPTDIRDNWKRALRDQLGDLSDWRNPHIVVLESRLTEWGPQRDEIVIRCEECDDQLASGPHRRVLAVLEHYGSHPFAISDCDPWDVRCTVPSGRYPCYLPNPLIPDRDPLQNNFCRVPIVQLYEKLAEAHRRGWQVNNKYFFLPPTDWRLEDVSRDDWRGGRAFPRALSTEREQTGYSDFARRVWVWHEGEDHWDVQLGGTNRIKVSHTGDPI